MMLHGQFTTNKHLLVRIVLIIFIGVVIIGGGGALFLIENPAGAAQFTDAVLRPLLGDRSVIALEGVVFGVQDQVKKAVHATPQPASYQVGVATEPLIPVVSVGVPQNVVRAVSEIAPPPAVTNDGQSNPLPGEGMWTRITGTPLDTAFVRTDPDRPYAVVNLVHIPMQSLSLGMVAGTKHPGGELGLAGSGKVPDVIQQSGTLLAAFNGGFQEKDGHFGMVADGVTYVPLKKSLATLFIHQDGRVTLGAYDGNPLPQDVTAARQNGSLLITNGAITGATTTKGVDIWGGTAAGDFITWRSGIGIAVDGDLIYAVGPSLTPVALATALQLAGSVNAMELDINDFWVRFLLYHHNVDGTYGSSPLVKGLTNDGQPYLKGNEKDFFYLNTK